MQQHIDPAHRIKIVITAPTQRQIVIPIPAQCHGLYGQELQQELLPSSSRLGATGVSSDAFTKNRIYSVFANFMSNWSTLGDYSVTDIEQHEYEF